MSRRPARGFLTAPFIVAVCLLGIALAFAGPLARRVKLNQAKLPLPLKSGLASLDVSTLAPYRVAERQVLEAAIVGPLGTNEYLSWILEDTSVSERDPLRFASLLVTYYSGGRDLVPHVPDVCYLGTGYEPAQPHENLEVLIEGVGAVPLRVLTFETTSIHDRRKISVVYTFFCNGQFEATRTGVRMLINDWANTYAYFSKVEVSFPDATRAQNIKGAAKLFGRLLPVLIDRHWPDFAAAEESVKQSANGRL